MPTRRQTLIGLGNVLAGTAVGTGAFDSAFARPSADLAVLADVRTPPGIKLLPGRSDEAHVETDQDGEVTSIVLADSNGPGLNKGAETRFEDIVELHKEPPGPPIDELYFEFEVGDLGLGATDPAPSEIESTLFIAAADGDVPGDGSTNYLQATNVGDAHNDLLSPNQHVPFGVGVDLTAPGITDLPDPDRFGVVLNITADHLPQGPPGGSGGNGPP